MKICASVINEINAQRHIEKFYFVCSVEYDVDLFYVAWAMTEKQRWLPFL